MNKYNKYTNDKEEVSIEVDDNNCIIKLNGSGESLLSVDTVDDFFDILEVFKVAGEDFKKRVYRRKGFDKI